MLLNQRIHFFVLDELTFENTVMLIFSRTRILKSTVPCPSILGTVQYLHHECLKTKVQSSSFKSHSPQLVGVYT